MITQFSHVFDDFHSVATETIMLSNTSVQWARRICRNIADANEQWQSLLQALAIAGFEQWLNQSSTQLEITYPKSTVPSTNANFQVENFQLCILSIGTLKDSQIKIPSTAVAGENAAHLYILVQVYEEIGQVYVSAGLRHDQLEAYIQQHLKNMSEEYVIPVNEFIVTPEQILIYLNCLTSKAFLQ